MDVTKRPVVLTENMIAVCGDHSIPAGWAHCRCGKQALYGAQYCGCADHRATK